MAPVPAMVTVWLATVQPASAKTAALAAACTHDERARAAAFRSPEHGAGWLVARGVLRSLLATALGTEAEGVALAETAAGKPFLAAMPGGRPSLAEAPGGRPFLAETPAGETFLDASDRAGVQFSLSYAGGLVAVALADRPVGIDIEVEHPLWRPERLADRLLGTGSQERARWASIPDADRTRALLRHWTRTEAVLKATGEGIAGGMTRAVPRLRAQGWEVGDLEIPPPTGPPTPRAAVAVVHPVGPDRSAREGAAAGGAGGAGGGGLVGPGVVGAVAAWGRDWALAAPHWLDG